MWWWTYRKSGSIKIFLICASLISELCNDFEENLFDKSIDETKIRHQHAELPYMEERFLKDTDALLKMFLSRGNLFNVEQ